MDDLRSTTPPPGPSYLALGLASVLSAERRETCRLSALGVLGAEAAQGGAEAAQGGAVADPCCGNGKVLQLALGIWPKECTGDGFSRKISGFPLNVSNPMVHRS